MGIMAHNAVDAAMDTISDFVLHGRYFDLVRFYEGAQKGLVGLV